MSEKTPISPIGTSRAGTMDTVGSDNAIPAEVGDVGALLVERLRAWKHAVGYLEAYITQTESLHKVLHKEYAKVLKTVDEPLREGHHFNQSVGGVASFFENLRANTVRLSQSHTETASELKSTVLPILERLHKEIRDRQKHVQAECEKSNKAVTKARNSTQQHIELLGQHAAAFESAGGVSAGSHGGLLLKLHHTNTGGKPKPENDPYLLKKGVMNRLSKQVLEENSQRQDLIGVQNHSQQFEAHVVETIQSALTAFNHTLGTQGDIQKQLYGDILEKGNSIPPDFEFVNFLTRNAETLIDPSAPKRTVESIRYPNEDHHSTTPLMEGSLARKGKIMRSYNSAYYVVTPSKYLHEFKDTDHLNKDSEPEMSLYLPECTIGALSKEGKFQISGKDAGSALKGLSTKHDFAFKAGNYSEAQKWYEAIGKCAGLKTDQSPVSTPTTTTPAAVETSPPAYEAPAGQETGTTTVATRSSAPAGQETGTTTVATGSSAPTPAAAPAAAPATAPAAAPAAVPAAAPAPAPVEKAA